MGFFSIVRAAPKHLLRISTPSKLFFFCSQISGLKHLLRHPSATFLICSVIILYSCLFLFYSVSIPYRRESMLLLWISQGVWMFKLDVELCSLFHLSFAVKKQLERADDVELKKKKYFVDVIDVDWWTDCIIVLANMTGCVFMYDILNCVKVSENDPMFCMPLIERAKHHQGFIFILEKESSMRTGHNSQQMEHATSENHNKQDTDRSCWSLISFSERSVLEMYTVLIQSHKYQATLEFASHHQLDTDEVFKAQWLHSFQGISEINLYLSKIKDLMFVLPECLNRVGTTEDIVQALLSHGLRISDRYEFSDSDVSDCSSIWNIRM